MRCLCVCVYVCVCVCLCVCEREREERERERSELCIQCAVYEVRGVHMRYRRRCCSTPARTYLFEVCVRGVCMRYALAVCAYAVCA
jgi:hypothetical protein